VSNDCNSAGNPLPEVRMLLESFVSGLDHKLAMRLRVLKSAGASMVGHVKY
jgi:hypothetical protein